MKKKKLCDFKKRQVLFAVFAFAFVFASQNMAFSIGNIYFNDQAQSVGKILKHDGTSSFGNADLYFDPNYNSKKVEIFFGSGADNPEANPALPAGSAIHSTSGYPLKYVIDQTANHNLQFRVWDGTPRTAGSYYGYTDKGYKVSGNAFTQAELVSANIDNLTDGTTSQPSYMVIQSFTTNYLYGAPYAPKIIWPVEESALRDLPILRGTTDPTDFVWQLKLNCNYAQTQGGVTVPSSSIASYDWAYWPTGGSRAATTPPATAKHKTGQTITLKSTDVDFNKEYGFAVRAVSRYNISPKEGPYSTILYYTPIGAGGTGGTVTYKYTLYPPDPNKLVVNSIAIPSLNVVKKASDLVTIINTTPRPTDLVTALSRGNPKAGEYVKYIPGTTASDFDLEVGDCIQVYIKGNQKYDIEIN